MNSYLQLLQHILVNGQARGDRTGVGTIGVFGYQLRHDLNEGFPLLTTKRVSFKNIITELLWFLRGGTNIAYLHEHGCRIWDEWAGPTGELGPVYGDQWRNYRGIEKQPGKTGEATVTVDQIRELVTNLQANPLSRRHIVTAWNPADIKNMALPPCHTLWQCFVSNDGKLSLHLYARSIDSFLGLPYNVASYALLVHLLANTCGLGLGELVISFGDLHIYQNHLEQVGEQLKRAPRLLPRVWLTAPLGLPIDEYTHDHIVLEDYNPHPAISAPVAV